MFCVFGCVWLFGCSFVLICLLACLFVCWVGLLIRRVGCLVVEFVCIVLFVCLLFALFGLFVPEQRYPWLQCLGQVLCLLVCLCGVVCVVFCLFVCFLSEHHCAKLCALSASFVLCAEVVRRVLKFCALAQVLCSAFCPLCPKNAALRSSFVLCAVSSVLCALCP